MVFGTYYLFFGKRSGFVNWRRIANPILITTSVAIIIQLIGVGEYIPDFIISIFEMLGSMALPLLMLILGGNIYIDFKASGKIYVWEVIKFVLAKNVFFPLVFIGMLLLTKPDYSLALIIFLQSAVPPITAIPILAERCGGNRNIASQFVLGSFIFSVISIPAMVYLFIMFFPIP
jgi:predicted permease